mmetsp:Transcript_30034/g.29288  ORF Transcript_30034/g.29288 Transcript_30034/m.29288 type:complete len:95 (-) Transcript_30034:530-814(-)
MRNLISIVRTPHQIVIAGNTFNNNDVVKGVVYIESEHRSKPVLIANNDFVENFAYFSASAIFIRAFTDTGKSAMDIVNSPVTGETDLQCGYYSI